MIANPVCRIELIIVQKPIICNLTDTVYLCHLF